MEFTLKEEHLKLLKRMYVGWSECEFGAPEINPKRPYGNSDVIGDIHEILTGDTNSENISDELYDYYNNLHYDTQIALQIAVRTQQFKLGRYRKTELYRQNWEFIGD